ncbi:MAG: pitrilysin family protein [Leptospirales bacterium]
MKLLTRKVLFFLLIFIPVVGSAWAEAVESKKIRQEFQSRIRKYTLDNGLRIILMQNKTSPVIACYLKIGVGSSNEPFDQAGTAHFLEHLLFKGTETLGTRDFAKEEKYLIQIEIYGTKIDSIKNKLKDPLLSSVKRIEYERKLSELEKRLVMMQKFSEGLIISEEDSKIYSLAGQVGYNAYTSSDVTNYQIKLPRNRLELWAYLESERFLNPVFREFYQERDVILEERRMRYDSKPASLLYELFNKTAYGMSPYGKPVIGFESNIQKLTEKNTRDFFNRNYIPSRMVIAIVGDIEFDEAYKTLHKYFSRLPAGEEPDFPPIEYEEPLGRKTATLEADHTPYMITGWVKPSMSHPDDAAYDVLERVLTEGKTSRLIHRLVIRERIATFVGAYNGIPGGKLPNHFAIFVGAYSEDSYEQIWKATQEELSKIAENGVTDAELDKVKNNVMVELLGELSSNGGMADTLSYYELMLNDYNVFFDYIDRIQNVKSEDIQAIVQKTFIDRKNTTVWIKKPEK